MPLASGTKLGPYQIVELLGAGGMGQVYRAHDSRLKRDVALKILPGDLCTDPDRRARFEREARAAGQLNHPNILAVFDVGADNGTPYIVSELLEGETLGERLRKNPIPARKALEYAALAARGLGAAHDKGIVHRDIKPGNIFICADGQIKILDFGLARLAPRENAESGDTVSFSERTAPGVVLGTAAYMSPEQACARPVDARSDIFSLGAVLYEMLSRQRAFSGESYADLISSVLKDNPPPLPISAKSLPGIERVVLRCLEKSPSERFQSARDLAFQLEAMSTSDSESLASVPAPAFNPAKLAHRLGLLPWLVAAVLVCVLASLAWWLRGQSLKNSSNSAVQFERLTDFYGMEESPALSPDGKSVAFVSDSTGSRQIWVRLLAGGPPLQLTHDLGDHFSPRWSPDSASLFYYTPSTDNTSQATIWEISALGGTSRRVVEGLSEVDPSHDGKSLAFFRLHGSQIQLVRTDRDASHPQVLAEFLSKTGCRQPRWSPDDSYIAFILATDRWSDDVFYVSSKGGSPHQVTSDTDLFSGFSWLPDASGLVYSSSRNSTLFYLPTLHLWSVALDGRKLRQLTFGDESDESPDIDSRGRLVESRLHINFDIWKFPIGPNPGENVRRAIRITHQTGQVQTPSPSPDGQQLVYLSDTGGHGNLWILDLNTDQTRQVTFEKEPGIAMGVPLWSPDGSQIAYARNPGLSRSDKNAYWLIRADGSNNHLFMRDAAWFAWSWDSHWAYYVDISQPQGATNTSVIKKLPLDGGSPMDVRNDLASAPAPGPDGSTLYYLKVLEPVNGLWDYELRVARPETAASEVLVRIPGQRVPAWQGLHPSISPDGKWLALPLNDRLGTNIWLLSTIDGKMHPLTDFGDRRILIARRVSWSRDNKYIFAAVGEGDSDIVLLSNLLH